MIRLNQLDTYSNLVQKYNDEVGQVVSDSILGGVYSSYNKLVEANLQAVVGAPVVLTSSGTASMLIGLEYALQKAALDQKIVVHVSEYLYFSFVSRVASLQCEVRVLKSKHLYNEVQLEQAEYEEDAFHIFIVTSHNNENVELVRPKQSFVIEDRCVVLGVPFTHTADVCCYSFSNNKMIAAGEGGAISSNDLDFIEWARWRTFSSIEPTHRHPTFMYMGKYTVKPHYSPFKCSMSSLVAIMINVQLSNLEQSKNTRRSNYKQLADKLCFNEYQKTDCECPLFYPLVLPQPLELQELQNIQKNWFKKGLMTYVGVLPIDHFNNQKIYKQVVSLPTHTALTYENIQHIITIVTEEL